MLLLGFALTVIVGLAVVATIWNVAGSEVKRMLGGAVGMRLRSPAGSMSLQPHACAFTCLGQLCSGCERGPCVSCSTAGTVNDTTDFRFRVLVRFGGLHTRAQNEVVACGAGTWKRPSAH